MKYFLSILLVLVFFNIQLAQTTHVVAPDSIQENNSKFAIKLDFFRLLYKVPSIQLSLDYRYNARFAFESEINYYLKYQNHTRDVPNLDDLYINLDQRKINMFASGIAKIYVDKRKHFYAGLRGFIGVVNLNLKRTICLKTELSTSEVICRCLEFGKKKLDVKKVITGMGPRIGLNLPVGKKITIDVYLDVFGATLKKNMDYEPLNHDNSCGLDLTYGWRQPYFTKDPRTDGIFSDELIPRISKTVILFSIKFGYVL